MMAKVVIWRTYVNLILHFNTKKITSSHSFHFNSPQNIYLFRFPYTTKELDGPFDISKRLLLELF